MIRHYKLCLSIVLFVLCIVNHAAAQATPAVIYSAADTRLHFARELHTFYTERAHAPVWIERSKPNKAARHLQQIITQADAEALNPEDYHASAIDALWKNRNETALRDLELLLSDAVLAIRYPLVARAHQPQATGHQLASTPTRVERPHTLSRSCGDSPQNHSYTRLSAKTDQGLPPTGAHVGAVS